MNLKSGDEVIIESAEGIPRWVEGFAGIVVNVYRKRASVNLYVDPKNFHLVRFENLSKIERTVL